MTDAKNTNQSPVQQGEVMIHVENLKKSFGDNVVLNGITQDIRKGEKVVIIGPSGSGKSTFLRCLNLLEVPTSGHLIFEGQISPTGIPISTRSAERWEWSSSACTLTSSQHDGPQEHHSGSRAHRLHEAGRGGRGSRAPAGACRPSRQG